MVHKYKRKTTRGNWDKAEMLEAVKTVLDKKLSLRRASIQYGLPKATLLRWCHKAQTDGIELTDFRRGYYKNVFTDEQENQLKEYVKEMNLSIYKMNSMELRRIAFQFAEKHNIPHKFNKESQLAGYHWYANFMKRQRLQKMAAADPLNNLSGEGTSSSNKMKTFPELLTDLQHLYNYSANRIYNVNETAVISVPSMTSKIVCESDKNELQNEFITMINCCNAAGDFVPPMLIYPASIEDPEFMKGCPEGTKIVCHPSGSIQSGIFYPAWFNHFIDYAKPSKEDPILLLLSGHDQHVKNLDFIEKTREISAHILYVPNKVVHPLEINFIKSLKKHYSDEQNDWIEETGRVINLKNIGQIFGKAYRKSAISSHAINGFRDSGMFPLDQEILSRTISSLKLNTLTKDNLDDIAGPSSDQNKSNDSIIGDHSDINNIFFDDLLREENSNTSDSNQLLDDANMPVEMLFVECKEDHIESE